MHSEVFKFKYTDSAIHSKKQQKLRETDRQVDDCG